MVFFENMLVEKRLHFYEARTPSCLFKQYVRLKRLGLLRDQLMTEHTRAHNGASTVSFSKVEASLNDAHIASSRIELSDHVEVSMLRSYNRLLRLIKRAEADTFLWQALADKVTGTNNPFVDANTLAVLFVDNRFVQIKSNEVCKHALDELFVAIGHFLVLFYCYRYGWVGRLMSISVWLIWAPLSQQTDIFRASSAPLSTKVTLQWTTYFTTMTSSRRYSRLCSFCAIMAS